MTKLKISVTKQVLKNSMYCSTELIGENSSENIGFNCAISRAVVEIFPNAWVERRTIFPFGDKIKYRATATEEYMKLKHPYITLPIEATKFIVNFDGLSIVPEKRLEMNELSFEIEVSDEIIEKLQIPELEEVIKQSKTLELV